MATDRASWEECGSVRPWANMAESHSVSNLQGLRRNLRRLPRKALQAEMQNCELHKVRCRRNVTQPAVAVVRREHAEPDRHRDGHAGVEGEEAARCDGRPDQPFPDQRAIPLARDLQPPTVHTERQQRQEDVRQHARVDTHQAVESNPELAPSAPKHNPPSRFVCLYGRLRCVPRPAKDVRVVRYGPLPRYAVWATRAADNRCPSSSCRPTIRRTIVCFLLARLYALAAEPLPAQRRNMATVGAFRGFLWGANLHLNYRHRRSISKIAANSPTNRRHNSRFAGARQDSAKHRAKSRQAATPIRTTWSGNWSPATPMKKDSRKNRSPSKGRRQIGRSTPHVGDTQNNKSKIGRRAIFELFLWVSLH